MRDFGLEKFIEPVASSALYSQTVEMKLENLTSSVLSGNYHFNCSAQ